jgi:hypothetical protein
MPAKTYSGGNDDGVEGTTTSHDHNGVIGRNTASTAKGNAAQTGSGVLGVTAVPDGAGVLGIHANTGFGVSGVGLVGVWGGSLNGVGVLGISAPPGQKGGDGVQGITNSEQRNGVYGRNDATAARGGDAPLGNGVMGYSRVPDAAGVMGVSGAGGTGVQGASSGHALFGKGGFGVTGMGSHSGVWGIADGAGAWAGQFTGQVYVTDTLTVSNPGGECIHAVTSSPHVAAVAAYQANLTSDSAALYAKHAGGKAAAFFDGNVFITGDIALINGADCAEEFDVADLAEAEAGTLMILGEAGTLEPCSSANDSRVIGVVSGAGDYRPGLILDRKSGAANRRPIALMGKVFCKVDADHGVVRAGDLLTSSPTLGHAMRVTDRDAAFGAVIGKALAPLAAGRGMIPVLVALQ